MKQDLVRFGVAMEARLIEQLDDLATARGCSRGELLRDLARAEVARSVLTKRVPAVAAVTLVYNHHVRELTDRLTAIQHDLGESVRSAMHVHLDHEHCMEVIVMRGRSDELQQAADRMLGTRGVTQGGIELVAESALASAGSHRRERTVEGAHDHAHPTHHPHAHAHASAPRKGGSATPAKKAPRKSARKSG